MSKEWENLAEQFRRYEQVVRDNPTSALSVVYQMLEDFELTLRQAKSSGLDSVIKIIDSPLTPREREVLTLAAQGQPSKEIAYLLDITMRTVQFHMTSIFKKLSVGSRTEAVAKALDNGWISS